MLWACGARTLRAYGALGSVAGDRVLYLMPACATCGYGGGSDLLLVVPDDEDEQTEEQEKELVEAGS